jgi:biopolymer transport protein ExbD
MRYLLGKQHWRIQLLRRIPWRQSFQLTIVVFSALGFLASQRVCAQTVDATIIALPTDNEFYLNKAQVPRQELAAAVYTLLRELPEEKRVVYIKAAADVKYGSVVSLINELKDNGYRVGLLTDAEKRQDVDVDAGRRNRSDNQMSPGPAPATSETNKAAGNEGVTVAVSVGRGNKMRVRVNSKPVAINQLTSTVIGILKASAVKNVRLVAPPTMSYGVIVEIIDLIKASGGTPIELKTTQ